MSAFETSFILAVDEDATLDECPLNFCVNIRIRKEFPFPSADQYRCDRSSGGSFQDTCSSWRCGTVKSYLSLPAQSGFAGAVKRISIHFQQLELHNSAIQGGKAVFYHEFI